MYRSCLVCGSDKIIPNLDLQDTGGHPSTTHGISVASRPDAFLFRGKVSGRLTASVCGDCGYVAFFVDRSRELYEAYAQAQRTADR